MAYVANIGSVTILANATEGDFSIEWNAEDGIFELLTGSSTRDAVKDLSVAGKPLEGYPSGIELPVQKLDEYMSTAGRPARPGGKVQNGQTFKGTYVVPVAPAADTIIQLYAIVR